MKGGAGMLAGCVALAAVGCGEAPLARCDALPGDYVHVDTAAHRLQLCRILHSEAQFRVRLGHGGVGKRREGDHRTPLGTYALGEPRPSERFGTFLPVEYPTPEQQAQGYTGSAIGIHGPSRAYAWLGSANTWFDTTEGCIGLASDREMEQISHWLRASAAELVYIE